MSRFPIQAFQCVSGNVLILVLAVRVRNSRLPYAIVAATMRPYRYILSIASCAPLGKLQYKFGRNLFVPALASTMPPGPRADVVRHPQPHFEVYGCSALSVEQHTAVLTPLDLASLHTLGPQPPINEPGYSARPVDLRKLGWALGPRTSTPRRRTRLFDHGDHGNCHACVTVNFFWQCTEPEPLQIQVRYNGIVKAILILVGDYGGCVHRVHRCCQIMEAAGRPSATHERKNPWPVGGVGQK
jgi:hypothetical protein